MFQKFWFLFNFAIEWKSENSKESPLFFTFFGTVTLFKNLSLLFFWKFCIVFKWSHFIFFSILQQTFSIFQKTQRVIFLQFLALRILRKRLFFDLKFGFLTEPAGYYRIFSRPSFFRHCATFFQFVVIKAPRFFSRNDISKNEAFSELSRHFGFVDTLLSWMLFPELFLRLLFPIE